ncbi:MAG: hypothetical protein ACI91O_000831 [Candidatus Poriferisodalaceae bacterium]|jgi:hypothetical protein
MRGANWKHVNVGEVVEISSRLTTLSGSTIRGSCTFTPRRQVEFESRSRVTSSRSNENPGAPHNAAADP